MAKRQRSKRRGLPGWRLVFIVTAALLGATALLVLPLRWLAPPTTAFMLHAGTEGLGGAGPCSRIERRWVDWEQIAPAMPLAAIAAEDQRFPRHWGLDMDAIVTALGERLDTGRVRGASTITQQLVKNLFLWPDQSLPRKALEAWLALSVEALWTKQRILEVYLNVVQFGDCTFGVEAASRRYFDKSAAELSESEAARLAASLPNPVRLRVERPGDHLRRKTAWVLEQMRALGGQRLLNAL